jgi:hypothetical protein
VAAFLYKVYRIHYIIINFILNYKQRTGTCPIKALKSINRQAPKGASYKMKEGEGLVNQPKQMKELQMQLEQANRDERLFKAWKLIMKEVE